MSNVLSAYNPTFYAQEVLRELEMQLGMANRVQRRLETEKSADPGDTITIKVPGTFTAQNAPSAAQDVKASKVDVTLDQWKEVKFVVTDKELAYTRERLINDHIRPAAYALATQIDSSLCGLWKDIPWYSDLTSPAAVADITKVRQILFDNKVPMDPSALHFMVSGVIESELLALQAFSQFQGAGPNGVATQQSGLLGPKYGFNFFANQNVQSATSATVADLAGAVNNAAGYAKDIKTIAVDGLTIAAAFKIGDIVKVSGHVQQYVLTADSTLDGTGAGNISFEPGLEAAVVDNQVVNVVLSGDSGTTKVQNLAFHRDFATLVMVPLPEIGNGKGAMISTINDPVTNLSLRARLFYDGNNSQLYVALDCLYGLKTLRRNMAVRARD